MHIRTALQVGKYLITSLTRLDDRGRYAASVSIRSGRGSGTHDRVLRLAPLFRSRADAQRHALDQGLAWIAASGSPCQFQPAIQE
ncbi:MAG: hypothetical protein L6Q73_19165 [Aquabacterium sp.]|nr:hypothetical protein [Aquabacterium sp.]